ncbi:MAG: VanW family protein [Lapillicoccus sp.]
MPRGRAGVALWTGIGLAVAAAAYLVLALVVGRQVPTTASVEGVDLGGLSRDQAVSRLDQELVGVATAEIVVTLGSTGRTFALKPAEAGLSLDIPGTLEGVTGFTLNPVRIWQHLSGTVARRVLTTVDAEKLTAAVTARAKESEVAPKNGAVSFADGKATGVAAVTGLAVPVDPLVRQVAAAYPRSTGVTAEVRLTPPAVTREDVDAALSAFARPAMSGPVTLAAGAATATLAPDRFGTALSMQPSSEGALIPIVDKAKLGALVTEALSAVLPTAQDARIVIENNAPKVLAAVDGVAVDASAAADVVAAALTAADRTARLSTTTSAPSLTTAAAQALGVKELVASFDSRFPYNPSRTANLLTASNTINGTLLKPGETFSLNGILGERTEAKGYREGYVIESGRLVKGVGGGISQVSTVVYNLAWFSGATLVEHTPHAFYISRYPEGREATVYWPTVDNRFTNGTPHGMFIQMWVADSQVHGRVWSTKVYDVESVKSPRTNVRPGKSITDDTVACVPQPEMTPGFDVTVTRIIKQGGAEVKREQYSTQYQPEDRIVCTNPNHQN